MRQLSRCLPLLALLPTFIDAQSPPDELHRLLEKSQQETNQGQYDAAEADLTLALAQARASNNRVLEFRADESLSRLKERQNDLDAAELWLNSAVECLRRYNPGSESVALLDLQAFYAHHHLLGKEADNIKRMIEAWSSVAGSDSLGVASLTESLAQVHFSTGDNASAERELRSVIAIYEKNGISASFACDLVRRHLLKVLTKVGDQDAMAELRTYIQPDPPRRERPDVFPHVISQTEPKYPEKTLKTRLSTSVAIALDVDETGHPQNLRLLQPMGLGFDENAVATVSTWRFRPATRNGVPVACGAEVVVTFRLYPNTQPVKSSQ
jgi:TonB family protein